MQNFILSLIQINNNIFLYRIPSNIIICKYYYRDHMGYLLAGSLADIFNF